MSGGHRASPADEREMVAMTSATQRTSPNLSTVALSAMNVLNNVLKLHYKRN
jgi:hypothetical protein